VFGVIPAAVTAGIVAYVVHRGLLAFDFRNDFWAAGWRLLHGRDLYRWPQSQVAGGISFPYPASTAVLFAPFALIARGPAGALFTVLCVLATLGTLWALSVRDWRLYGLVLLWSPVMVGWQTANLTPAMALLLALVWRWRRHALRTGVLVALLVCLKPIVLPMGLWLLATRRYAAAAWAVGFAAVASVASWALVGFGAISEWLHLLSLQGDLLFRKGYGLIAFAADAGLSRGTGTVLAAVVTCVLAVSCVLAGWRRLELAAFTLTVAMMITISPQVDEHYFMLLIVPLAIVRPRLEPIWLLPVILWLAPTNTFQLWQVVLYWVVAAVVLIVCLRSALRDGDVLGAPAGPRSPGARAGRASPSPA
jgi:alpha-1,2-mannosyltransferase